MDINLIKERFSDFSNTSTRRINEGSKDFFAPDAAFVEAAVLVPLLIGDDGLDVLLTKRASHLKHHPGQVSFPGGRREPEDSSLEVTALRETHEETGISPDFVEIVGHLPRMYTISAYDVDPVVGLVRSGYTLQPDASEVDSIFTVPLAYLADDGHRIDSDVTYRGTDVAMVEWHYQDQRIWGATAAMILTLLNTLALPSGSR
ncbi:MAG: CoA pyrophosphatase [Gammaproteobacteria bacterium]